MERVSGTIVGQSKFIERVVGLRSLPQFCIIEGARGSGKATLVKYIAELYKLPLITINSKVDDIRQMLAESKKLRQKTIYFIKDADTMSIGAKNSLLKVTEEPPKNLIIFMSLESKDNTLATIKSRANILTMDPYSFDELQDYLLTNYELPGDENLVNEILEVVTTPGEINEIMSIGFEEFLQYVNKVYLNILEVSTGNSFKIPNKLKFKKDDGGYSCELFLKVFQKISADDLKSRQFDNTYNMTRDEVLRDVHIMRCTNKALKEIMDIWILNVRRFR